MQHELIDWGKLKTQQIPVEDLWFSFNSGVPGEGHINPRLLSELKYRNLLNSVEKESGVILKPGAVLRLFPEDYGKLTFNDPITGEIIPPPDQSVKSILVLIIGHRRATCLLHFRRHPGDYSHQIFENAAKFPAIVFECSLEKAQQMALDDGAKEMLSKANIIEVVFDKFKNGWSYSDVVMEMPETLYRHFRVSGTVRKWSEVAVLNAKEREAAIKKDLKNDIDTNLLTCHKIGFGVVEQRILNQRKADGQKDVLGIVLDTKHTNIVELQKLYNACNKETYKPVRVLKTTPTPPKGDDVSTMPSPGGDYYVVAGGNQEIRDKLLGLMKQFREGIKPDRNEIKPPNKSEREDIMAGTLSQIGKAMAKTYCGIDNAERIALDTRAFYLEQMSEALTNLTGMSGDVEALRVALLGKDPDKAVESFVNINKALTAKNGTGAKKAPVKSK